MTGKVSKYLGPSIKKIMLNMSNVISGDVQELSMEVSMIPIR